MPSQAVSEALDEAVIRLNSNFDKYVDEAAYLVQLKEWMTAAEAHPWLTAELVDAALEHFLYRDPNDAEGPERQAQKKVPPVGEFIGVCRRLKQRDDQRAAGERALPPPQNPNRPDPGFYARNVAIGKARMRKRKAHISAYRATLPPGVWKYGGEQSHHWKGRDTPTEAEIDDVLREMHKQGQINADTLAAALELRCPVNVLNVEHLESKIAVGVPGEAAAPTTDTKPGVAVRWKDGKESRVSFADEQSARQAERWLRTHTP
jgi:hypothetical protein